MSARARESRPVGNGAAIANSISLAAASSFTDAGDVRNDEALAVLTPRVVRGAVEDVLAAVVVRADDAGRISRRTFLTLASAERAVKRAESAGHEAVVALVRLQLVAGVPGGGVPHE